MESQKQMRIKVNRIAIFQTLKVEHVMDYLKQHGVFTDADEATIMAAGRHPYDRAKALVQSFQRPGRKTEWYSHFREALKNPAAQDLETRKKYLILVEFLDNTIITAPRPPNIPKSKMQLPHYDPLPSIPPPSDTPGSKGYGSRVGSRVTFNIGMTPDEEDERLIMAGSDSVKTTHLGDEEKAIVKRRPPESREQMERYLEEMVRRAGMLTIPEDHFRAIWSSGDPEDVRQWEAEMSVLQNMKNLLDLYVQAQVGDLSDDTVFFREPAVMKVIEDEKHHHLYYKYLGPLIAQRQMNILNDIIGTFFKYVGEQEKAENHEERSELIYTAFLLANFLFGFGMFYQAERVIFCLILYLRTNPVMESWIGQWEAFIKIMAIRNTNLNFRGADSALRAASVMATNIKMMSFGQDLLDEVDMYVELSTLMREQGSVGPALAWAQQALKEVEQDNHEGIVDALCAAVHGYLGTDNVKRARQCALQAVKQARVFFGQYHPSYVKALLHYCLYSSHVGCSTIGVDIAKKTLEIATRVYGGASLQVAAAHSAVSKALHSAETHGTAEALHQAQTGHMMAKDLLQGDHPRLALFKLNLAETLMTHALKIKAEQGGDVLNDEQNVLLVTARSEVEAAQAAFESAWGTFSVHNAKCLLLLAQIEDELENKLNADRIYSESLCLLDLSVSRRSSVMAKAKVQIASVYHRQARDDDAVRLLEDAIKTADTGVVRQRWMQRAYALMIQVFQDKNEPQEAEKYNTWMQNWLESTRSLDEANWEQLNETPIPYELFLKEFDILKSKIGPHVRKGLFKSLKANLKRR